ncbi:MAG: acyl-CoA reductase [Syntrophobacteraceae bacterium]
MELSSFKHYIFGERHNFGADIPVEFARQVWDQSSLQSKSLQFMEAPIDEILMVLERTGQLLCDPGGSYLRTAMEILPELLEYTPQMVEYGLRALAGATSRDTLQDMLRQLGPNRYCLDHFINAKGARPLRALPLGTVCHVAAGNIFLGSVGSLIQGIITKNINILKVSSQDLVFPGLFVDALLEADIDRVVSPHLCVTYWDRNNHAVKDLVKQVSDLILLFGGEDSVLEYKNGLCAKAQTLAFGPKISFGLVARGQSEDRLKQAAAGFSEDIVLWEQRACTSCQNIFLEEDPSNDRFVELLLENLEAVADRFPPPALDIDRAVEIRKERELLKWREFKGEARSYEGHRAHHTVIVQRSDDLTDSLLHRTVLVNIVKDYTDVLRANLRHMKYYLSTVGVLADDRLQRICEDFIRSGVTRIVQPGDMSSGRAPRNPHDGKLIIESLVKLISSEGLQWERFGLESLETGKKKRHILSRINNLLLTAVKSPFYKEFYKDVKLPLRDLEELQSVPVLQKEHLFQCSVNENLRMVTGPADHCYVFASGGTTSQPKFLLYSLDEFEEAKRLFGEGFRATGIARTDVVVNYLKPGAFYTGFLAVNAGLEETGCRILSMSCNQSEEQSLEYLRAFSPNTIVAFPSALIRLALASEASGVPLVFEKVFYAGEYISQPDIDYVTRVFSAKSFRSFGYAAVETGNIGYQCLHCRGTEHHVAEDWCHVEINDEYEILVTTTGRTLFPVIRYNVGDQAEWASEPCKCGRTSPRIRLLDRSAKCIVLPASSISFQDVTNVAACFPGLTSIYQAVVDEDERGMTDICIRIETRNPKVAQDSLLQQSVEQSFKTDIHALRDYWEQNRIGRFQVELLPPGGISGVERTSKTRRVVDKRKSRP